MAEIVWESDAQMSGFAIMSNGMVWPDDWPGTLVEAQFTSARGDGADLDRDPDMVPSGPGRVIFTPQVRTVGYDGEHGKRIVSLHPFEAVVGDDGFLYTPDEYGQPGIRGIVLPSNNSDVVDEHDWTWRVTFDIPNTNIRPTHIPTPHDHSVDIKDYLDSDANHGVRVVVDRVAARETLTARDETLAARDLVLPARDQTLTARDQTLAHGLTVDTSVGTRVYVGNTMIHGDTGWRDISGLLEDEWSGTIAPQSNLLIRRENGFVMLEGRVEYVDLSGSRPRDSAVKVLDRGVVSNGFNYPRNYRVMGFASYYPAITASSPVEDGTLFAAGSLFIRFLGSTDNWSVSHAAGFSAVWSTSDAWPSSLPGLPA